MPAAPSTALDSREAELFAGREAELRLFVARFEPPPAPDERRVLLFTGVGGLGKSALARAIQRRLEEIKGLRSAAWAAIDFADAGGTDPVQACPQIRLQLGATLGLGVRFPVFDTAFARYHANRYPGSDISSQYQALNPNGELVRRLTRLLPEGDRDASLWQDLADGVAAVAEGVPLLGLGYKRLNQFAHWTQEQWDRRARDLLQDVDEITADAIALRLPRCLGADLEAAIAGMKARVPIAIIGDTAEAFHRGQGFTTGIGAFHNDAWLRELVWHSPGVLFVLLGRDPLAWHEHEHSPVRDWRRIVETRPVAPLGDDEAHRVLERFPVPEAPIRERMVAGFAGLPFYLGLQLDLYLDYQRAGQIPSLDVFGGAPDTIIIRFLSHLDQRVGRSLVTLAHARRFDEPLYRELRQRHPELVSDVRFGELTRYSFVEPGGEGWWRLHQLMRDILQARLAKDDPAEQGAIHEALFAYWDARCRPADVGRVDHDHERVLEEAAHHMAKLDLKRFVSWVFECWRLFRLAGRFGLVLRLWEQASVAAEAVYGRDHMLVANALGNLGNMRQNAGDSAGARQALERALDIQERAGGYGHPLVASTLTNLAGVLSSLDDHSGARRALRRALKIKERLFGSNHPETAITLTNLGVALLMTRDRVGARQVLERALAINERFFGPHYAGTAVTLEALGSVRLALGNLVGAREALERALDAFEHLYGRNNWSVATTLTRLAECLDRLRDFDQALNLRQRALKILETTFGPDHPHTLQIREQIARLERDT